ncbi:hypothetical protein [Lacticaseibacillus saniviri]|uniref:Uncharacterized protein n=1 Tax=Lacticaseibacillus saniviri JCM 17471 = DSM 24301 TaxID=1293598 RepID=A0A0R2N5L2_9LACO|nr:hypothetical protein [Lacticaseibacillus saniviri]KRO18346.1 hypothetical protein IV56_GL001478 [Lacticaseibacillus saniviri JCM 17471 = DSM 24301]MCG4282977.1 hypothetical protein [Lacticaseibacillus saniviri]
MLMYTRSGLNRFEVQKAKQLRGPVHTPSKFQVRQLPLGLLALGMSLLMFGELHQVLTIIVGIAMSLIVVAAGYYRLHQWQAALHVAPKQRVAVIREGLMRVVTVAELVAHDQLVLYAGDQLPVAVMADSAAFTIPFGVHKGSHNVVAAGAIANESMTVEIADADAVMAARNATFNPWQGSLVESLIFQVVGLVADLVALLQVSTRQIAVRINRFTQPIQTFTIAVLAQFLNQMTLIGHIRHHDREAAFRYNQTPVS